MAHPALTPNQMTTTALALSPRIAYLGVAAVISFAAAFYVSNQFLGVLLLSVGGMLAAVTAVVRWLSYRHGHSRTQLFNTISNFVANDASPSFVTDQEGEVGYVNAAAKDLFTDAKGQTLSHVLSEVFANPAAVLFRLQNKAVALGAAREDVVTRRGHIRLAVHQVGAEGFLWRLETLADKVTLGRGAEGLSLPMLTASKSGTILFMNDAMRRLLGGRVKTLDRVFTGLPLQNGVENDVATKDGIKRSLVAEVEGPGGRSEIYLLPGTEGVGAVRGWDFFDELPVPLVKIGQDAEVLLANRMARELLGDGVEAGTKFADLVEGLGRSVKDWVKEALDGRGLNRREMIRARRQEEEVFLQISLSRVIEDDQPVLVAVLTDATELKTLEAQFVQSQKMQAIGQLAGGVAHDFNNLLTAISGHCDLLMLRHDQGDPDFGDLVQISQNANRAASLVGQLLAFSRKQNLQPEIIDLRDTLADLTHLLNRLVGEKVSLSLSHDPGLSPIRADKRQLEQVLMNLVVNARDAMPDGGEIKIETRAVTLKEELQRDRAVVPSGEYVLVKVIDEGMGIAPDKLVKIFEPFYTTKRTGEGTGLGLSTAYGIIKQTGGYIFVDSAVGSGTCFSLYMPCYDRTDAPEPPKPVEAPKVSTKQGDGVILLVEDEAPVRAFASRALRMRGYTVLEAACAEDALQTLEDQDLNVDIFVTDVIMPGMDGPTWVKQALVERPEVKVVFVSGYAEGDFADNQAEIPNSVFLPKPFSLNDLTNTVQEQLH